LEVGKLADFAVLDGNPLTIDPMKIADIKVMETIKEARRVPPRRRHEERGSAPSCAESAACFLVASRALGRAGVVHFHDHKD